MPNTHIKRIAKIIIPPGNKKYNGQSHYTQETFYVRITMPDIYPLEKEKHRHIRKQGEKSSKLLICNRRGFCFVSFFS